MRGPITPIMMKYYMIIVTLCFAPVKAQQLNGIWVSDNFLELTIMDSVVNSELSFENNFKLVQKDGRLVFLGEDFVTQKKNDEPAFTEYIFDYRFINKDCLEISLFKIVGFDLGGFEKKYTLSRKETMPPKPIAFESVDFSATTCFGRCPKMKVQINATGEMVFVGEKHTGNCVGKYTGKLSSAQLRKFNEILKYSEIENLPKNFGADSDAPVYNLTIKYNGKMKNVSGTPMGNFHRPLLQFLLEIYKEVKLKKVE